jgi:hypothetical protein
VPKIRTKPALTIALFGLLLASAVAHATPATLSAAVTPTSGGSAASPAGHVVTTEVSHIAAGPDGNPTKGVNSMTLSFPVDLATNFGSYATCPESTVVHQDAKPNCPDGSILGHTEGAAYVPALHTTAHSDYGYIFKTGPSSVRTWTHVSKPAETSVVIPGVISKGTAPYGPVITWDMSTLPTGAEVGVEVDLSSFKWTWDSGTATAQPSNAKKRAACLRKAKKIKNKKKRKSAVRRCNKRYPKRPSRALTRVDASTTPFVSSGCTGGNWMFHAALTFFDKSTDTADAKVACQ